MHPTHQKWTHIAPKALKKGTNTICFDFLCLYCNLLITASPHVVPFWFLRLDKKRFLYQHFSVLSHNTPQWTGLVLSTAFHGRDHSCLETRKQGKSASLKGKKGMGRRLRSKPGTPKILSSRMIYTFIVCYITVFIIRLIKICLLKLEFKLL